MYRWSACRGKRIWQHTGMFALGKRKETKRRWPSRSERGARRVVAHVATGVWSLLLPTIKIRNHTRERKARFNNKPCRLSQLLLDTATLLWTTATLPWVTIYGSSRQMSKTSPESTACGCFTWEDHCPGGKGGIAKKIADKDPQEADDSSMIDDRILFALMSLSGCPTGLTPRFRQLPFKGNIWKLRIA